jgi:hypothetical protein
MMSVGFVGSLLAHSFDRLALSRYPGHPPTGAWERTGPAGPPKANLVQPASEVLPEPARSGLRHRGDPAPRAGCSRGQAQERILASPRLTSATGP